MIPQSATDWWVAGGLLVLCALGVAVQIYRAAQAEDE